MPLSFFQFRRPLSIEFRGVFEQFGVSGPQKDIAYVFSALEYSNYSVELSLVVHSRLEGVQLRAVWKILVGAGLPYPTNLGQHSAPPRVGLCCLVLVLHSKRHLVAGSQAFAAHQRCELRAVQRRESLRSLSGAARI